MIDWSLSEEEESTVAGISLRAAGYYPVMHTRMNVVACHKNGCPLDLDKLLASSDFDFLHDLAGIERHIDKETGELRNHFLPRCAA